MQQGLRSLGPSCAPWCVPQQMDNAVYTFETLLHQELGKVPTKEDLCKSIQRILERVLKVSGSARPWSCPKCGRALRPVPVGGAAHPLVQMRTLRPRPDHRPSILLPGPGASWLRAPFSLPAEIRL